MTIALWLLSPLTSSCAGPATGRAFDAPPDRVRAAVRVALRDFAEVREDGDRLATGWSAERPGAESGLLLGNEYRVRLRHEVSLAGSQVSVRSTVERRPPGGPRANRWERVNPRRAEEGLLAAIGARLETTP